MSTKPETKAKVKAEPKEAENGSGAQYPPAPMKSALTIADAVRQLGGSNSPVQKPLIVRHMGAVDSGSFRQLLRAARIYQLVEGNREYRLTQIGRRHFFPTSPGESRLALLESFGSP